MIEICLQIADDGTMTVSQEDVAAEMPENEAPEMAGSPIGESEGTPVQNIDQALQVIRQMAEAASMQAPAAVAEESAMNSAFQPRG